jgi:hypothetical protein
MNIITKEILDYQLKKRAFPKGTTGHQFIQSALEKSKCADLSKLTKSVYAACKCFYFHYFIYFVGCVFVVLCFPVRNSCELTRREVNRQKTKGELTLVGERIKFVNIELWKLET